MPARDSYRQVITWNIAVSAILACLMAYFLHSNRRLKRKVRTFEQICIDHQIAYRHYMDSEEDEQIESTSESNPFISKPKHRAQAKRSIVVRDAHD